MAWLIYSPCYSMHKVQHYNIVPYDCANDEQQYHARTTRQRLEAANEGLHEGCSNFISLGNTLYILYMHFSLPNIPESKNVQ